MINTEIFHELKRIETSSWAVWSERNENNLDFFLSKLSELHGKVIFVGLNRSNAANDFSKVAPLSNFHTKGHVGDRRLKRSVQDVQLTNLVGGFMTDISEQIETKSNLVKVEELSAVKNFTNKIRSIDDSQSRHIICFGDKVFNTFVNALGVSKKQMRVNSENKLKEIKISIGDEIWNLYRVWHYSNYGIFIHKSETELPIQLKYINDKIESE